MIIKQKHMIILQGRGQRKKTRSLSVLRFEISHLPLKCVNRKSHWPQSTTLVITTPPGTGAVGGSLGQGWERKTGSCLKAVCILSRKLWMLGKFTTQTNFSSVAVISIPFWFKKKKKDLFHIWYNTGSRRKAIVQQFLTTNTHLIASVALWKTKCMFGLFNFFKKLYYWNI